MKIYAAKCRLHVNNTKQSELYLYALLLKSTYHTIPIMLVPKGTETQKVQTQATIGEMSITNINHLHALQILLFVFMVVRWIHT